MLTISFNLFNYMQLNKQIKYMYITDNYVVF